MIKFFKLKKQSVEKKFKELRVFAGTPYIFSEVNWQFLINNEEFTRRRINLRIRNLKNFNYKKLRKFKMIKKIKTYLVKYNTF